MGYLIVIRSLIVSSGKMFYLKFVVLSNRNENLRKFVILIGFCIDSLLNILKSH